MVLLPDIQRPDLQQLRRPAGDLQHGVVRTRQRLIELVPLQRHGVDVLQQQRRLQWRLPAKCRRHQFEFGAVYIWTECQGSDEYFPGGIERGGDGECEWWWLGRCGGGLFA